MHSFASCNLPSAQQRSEAQPRPQPSPHTPGATHACNAPHPTAHCARACRRCQHEEDDTRVRTPVRDTHTRALAKRIATTIRARLASRVSNAAVVAAVRAAAPALAPLVACPRPAAPSAPEAPLVHVRCEHTAAHSARPPGTISGGERAGRGTGRGAGGRRARGADDMWLMLRQHCRPRAADAASTSADRERERSDAYTIAAARAAAAGQVGTGTPAATRVGAARPPLSAQSSATLEPHPSQPACAAAGHRTLGRHCLYTASACAAASAAAPEVPAAAPPRRPPP